MSTGTHSPRENERMPHAMIRWNFKERSGVDLIMSGTQRLAKNQASNERLRSREDAVDFGFS